MTNPKKISDLAKEVTEFAKEYQQTFIENAQLRSAYAIVVKERDELKEKVKELENEIII